MNDIQQYQFGLEVTLEEEMIHNGLDINSLEQLSNSCQSREGSYDVSFLLPTFKSNSPLVNWIISQYVWYQVSFVIIFVEFLVTVLSSTYLRNIFWGQAIPLICWSAYYHVKYI